MKFPLRKPIDDMDEDDDMPRGKKKGKGHESLMTIMMIRMEGQKGKKGKGKKPGCCPGMK